MTHKAMLILTASLALAACGRSGGLEPRPGNELPPKAYGQVDEQTSDRLLTPSTQQRPGRSDELLRRSERREDDPFDLPPGSVPDQPNSDESSDPAAPRVDDEPKNP